MSCPVPCPVWATDRGADGAPTWTAHHQGRRKPNLHLKASSTSRRPEDSYGTRSSIDALGCSRPSELREVKQGQGRASSTPVPGMLGALPGSRLPALCVPASLTLGVADPFLSCPLVLKALPPSFPCPRSSEWRVGHRSCSGRESLN